MQGSKSRINFLPLQSAPRLPLSVRPLVSISSPLRGGQYKILAADPSGIVERCPDGARFHPPVLH